MQFEPTGYASKASFRRIYPDVRAYVMIGLAMVPVLGIWVAAWWKRGTLVTPALPLIAGVALLGWFQLANKTLTLDSSGIVQGWPPFRNRIEYPEIGRIHYVAVSSRYASVHCLAVTSNANRKEIRLPTKSFSLAKRKHLVAFLKQRAPQVLIDKTVAL